MIRDLNKMKVPVGGTLLQALHAINESGIEIAFAVTEDDRVVGLMTDGDVRRAILAGTSLDARAIEATMTREFTAVAPAVNRAEVLDLMRARDISQIPVLDDRQRLVGVHLLRELVGMVDRENCAVIMAGGRGSRLMPVTDEVPKPMLRVAGRPILERIVLHLVGHGIHDIYLAINYLGELIRSHFADGSQLGCRIHYLEETEPLGTAGPLSLLPEIPTDPLLVLNGDLVTEFNVGSMFEFHQRGDFAMTVGVRPYGIRIPYGVAETENNRLLSMREKPTEQVLINAGVYVLSPDALKRVPAGTKYPMTQLVDELLDESRPVGAHCLEGDWMDVGHYQELRNARRSE